MSFPSLKHAPSYYFHRNVFLTFIDEPDVVRQAHERLGIRQPHVVVRLSPPGIELAQFTANHRTHIRRHLGGRP